MPCRRNVSWIEVDTDNEAEGIEPDIEAEPLLEEADRIVRLCSGAGKCPVGRGLQEDLDPAVLESLDEAVAALALVPDMAAAKEVLSLHDLSHFTLLPASCTDPATKAGLRAVRNTLALRGIGITKIRHSCDWDMNFQPLQRPIAWAGTSKPLCYLFPRGEGLSTCLQLLKGVMHLQELSVLPGSYGESRVPELRLGQAV